MRAASRHRVPKLRAFSGMAHFTCTKMGRRVQIDDKICYLTFLHFISYIAKKEQQTGMEWAIATSSTSVNKHKTELLILIRFIAAHVSGNMS